MNATIVDKGDGYRVVSITNAKIVGYPGSIWRKFKGVQTETGLKHTFVVYIDEQYVQMLKDRNFEVGYYNKEGRDPFYFLKITLSWRYSDPMVYVVAHNMVRTQQSEEAIGDLDQCDNIQFIDMDISASHYNSHGREGYTAYGKNVHFYLGASSLSEQLYLERYKNAAVERSQIQMPEPAQEPLPWEDDIPGLG